jgi:excisionase family DNA binding protein
LEVAFLAKSRYNGIMRDDKVTPEVETSALAASEMLNVSQVAELLGVSTGTVYNWAKEGRLRCYRQNRRWLFQPSDVKACQEALTPKPYIKEDTHHDRTNAPSMARG